MGMISGPGTTRRAEEAVCSSNGSMTVPSSRKAMGNKDSDPNVGRCHGKVEGFANTDKSLI